jgi:hypothetical protein
MFDAGKSVREIRLLACLSLLITRPRKDRDEKLTAGLGGITGLDKTCPAEPRASASGRQPRAKVTSDSLTLAVPSNRGEKPLPAYRPGWQAKACPTSGIEFFVGFRGPKAHSNRGEKPLVCDDWLAHLENCLKNRRQDRRRYRGVRSPAKACRASGAEFSWGQARRTLLH